MFVDASYWVGLADRQDRWHARAVALRSRVPRQASVLELAVAEAVTIVGSRRGGKPARQLYQFFRDSCRVVFVDSEILDASIDSLVTRDGRLSVADSATVQAMIRYEDMTILSFDSDFDGIRGVTRLH